MQLCKIRLSAESATTRILLDIKKAPILPVSSVGTPGVGNVIRRMMKRAMVRAPSVALGEASMLRNGFMFTGKKNKK
jgi:hypothetical protein